MNLNFARTILILVIGLSIFSQNSFAQENIDEQRAKVAMRRIGHRLLLQSGDSTSVVLPVEREGNRYKISFASKFAFLPDSLTKVIDYEISTAAIGDYYLVEVATCDSNEVVYSYEVGGMVSSTEVACLGREFGKECYAIFVTLIDEDLLKSVSSDAIALGDKSNTEQGNSANYLYYVVAAIALLLFIVIFSVSKRKRKQSEESELIPIGAYLFDKKNLELRLDGQKITLTSKEADLLYLLYISENIVLKREEILNSVWGDEGDYIGRTLDVFISKLRKKLASDEKLKIMNVHGVGYKFIVN